MPKLVHSPPKYRKHRASGQAVVTINGRDFYLGPHGTKASRREYDRIIGEWLQCGRTLAFADAKAGLTVLELVAAFWTHAKAFYVDRDGKPTSEVCNYQRVLKPLKELYAKLPVAEFGPIKLKVIREKLVTLGIARQTVNADMSRLRKVFKWGVEQELVVPSVLEALKAVDGLHAGKTTARETEPIKPVSEETIQQTLPNLPLVVSDMVLLQRHTGARPDEICMLRPCDLDRSADVWTYRPMHHKTEHHGKARLIYIGPKGQLILMAYLLRPAESFCFSPRESESKRRAERHAERKTPLGYGNRPGTNRKRKPATVPQDRYTTSSYRRAIHRACEVAFKMPAELRQVNNADEISDERRAQLRTEANAWRAEHCWSPNQLRHSAATAVRHQFDLEAAQVILGHAKADVTQKYAERNEALGREVARQIG